MKENLRWVDDHGHSPLAMFLIRAVEPYGIGVIDGHGEYLLL